MMAGEVGPQSIWQATLWGSSTSGMLAPGSLACLEETLLQDPVLLQAEAQSGPLHRALS